MNDLSNAAVREHRKSYSCDAIPAIALLILAALFFLGLAVSVFILVAVGNASFFIAFLLLSAFVAAFLAWNAVGYRMALGLFLRSLPDSDLRFAREGQLVRITGIASCGSASIESSYERFSRCVYTSTVLYERGRVGLKQVNAGRSCFLWNLAFCERFSTDFYITDHKSGIRAIVKAGAGCRVIPLIIESKLVTITKHNRILSPHLRKWLRDKNLSAESRPLRLEEGYIQEGDTMTVTGVLCKCDDVLMIVQPPDIVSTGCLWPRLFLPIEFDGLILSVPDTTRSLTNLTSIQTSAQ